MTPGWGLTSFQAAPELPSPPVRLPVIRAAEICWVVRMAGAVAKPPPPNLKEEGGYKCLYGVVD